MKRDSRPVSAWFGLLLAFGLAVGACAFPGLTPVPTAATTRPSPPAPVASATPLVWPLKDMSERPQIWFGPLDPANWSRTSGSAGPYDFLDLFAEDAPWEKVSDAARVMIQYSSWLETTASTSQLEQSFGELRRRRIGIAFEMGPLSEHGACNAATIEGYSGPPSARAIVQRIRSAGGVLYAYEMEHGFDAATYYDPACRMTPTEIAQDVSKTIVAVHEVFPDALIGAIETANLDVRDVGAWLDAYRDVIGHEMDFFHLDVNFSVPDWAERAAQIASLVQSRGIDFGIYYVGDYTDTTDAQWIAHAQDRLTEFEVIEGGRPDHAIFQSWNARPQTLLPEDQPGTFTNFILRYLRARTALSLELSDGTARGALTRREGAPLADEPLELSALPITGPGAFADYTLTGVVPEGATAADVGLRVNMECDCSGEADLILGSVGYLEEGQAASQVPNGRFSSALQGWGVWGAGTAEIVRGENGAFALHVDAVPGEDVGLNSDSFVVHAGRAYTLTFRARVDPPTAASGYFDIVFLNDAGEVSRLTLPIRVARQVLGAVQTQADGTYTFSLPGLPQGGSWRVRAWFAGDDEAWPAVAEGEFAP